jgi:hypothetical protein
VQLLPRTEVPALSMKTVSGELGALRAQAGALQTLTTRYKIEGRDDVLKTMAGALEAFASAAAN